MPYLETTPDARTEKDEGILADLVRELRRRNLPVSR